MHARALLQVSVHYRAWSFQCRVMCVHAVLPCRDRAVPWRDRAVPWRDRAVPWRDRAAAVWWPRSGCVITVQISDDRAWPCNNRAEWCFWHVEQAIDRVWVLRVHIQFFGYTGVEMWASKHFNSQLFGSCVTWLSMLLHKDTLAVSQGVLHRRWRFVAS